MIRIKGNPDEEAFLFLPEKKGVVCDTPRNALMEHDTVLDRKSDFGLLYRKDKSGRVNCYFIEGMELWSY